ncbi:MAG: hypothetical protein U0T69_11480 [Chitinophagales bacterium]
MAFTYLTTGKDNDITKTVEFYVNNPTIPAQFKIASGVLEKAPTNNMSKNAVVNPTGISAKTHLNINGDYTLTALYRGEDLFKEKPNVFTKEGNLQPNIELDPIIFVNGFLNIFAPANDLLALRKIEYLLYLDKYYPQTNNGVRLVEHTKPEDAVTTTGLDVFKYKDLVDKIATSELGTKMLIDKAMLFNEAATVIYETSGIDKIKEILQHAMLQNLSDFAKKFDSSATQKELIKKAIEKKVLDYNKKTDSYQFKDQDGAFIENEIIFSIKESDTIVRDLLFAEFLVKETEKFTKIKLILQNVKSKS